MNDSSITAELLLAGVRSEINEAFVNGAVRPGSHFHHQIGYYTKGGDKLAGGLPDCQGSPWVGAWYALRALLQTMPRQKISFVVVVACGKALILEEGETCPMKDPRDDPRCREVCMAAIASSAGILACLAPLNRESPDAVPTLGPWRYDQTSTTEAAIIESDVEAHKMLLWLKATTPTT